MFINMEKSVLYILLVNRKKMIIGKDAACRGPSRDMVENNAYYLSCQLLNEVNKA